MRKHNKINIISNIILDYYKQYNKIMWKNAKSKINYSLMVTSHVEDIVNRELYETPI